jgi:hypothetical protein
MTAKTRQVLLGAVLAMTLAAGAFAPQRASAQIDPMRAPFYIYQSGKVVGVIYVPPRAAPDLYIEHWVLFPSFIYHSMGSAAGVAAGIGGDAAMTIVPNPAFHIATEQDFFRSIPWGAGYRYVEVTAHEGTVLPGRETVGVDGR